MKKTVGFFGLVVAAAVLGGCVGVQPYPYASDAFSQQAPVQYAPPQQQVAPMQYAQPPASVYVGCRPPYVPSWNGCVLPAPAYYPFMPYGGGYYTPMYVDPFLSFRFNFNFGKGGKHHGGGRHHRR